MHWTAGALNWTVYSLYSNRGIMMIYMLFIYVVCVFFTLNSLYCTVCNHGIIKFYMLLIYVPCLIFNFRHYFILQTHLPHTNAYCYSMDTVLYMLVLTVKSKNYDSLNNNAYRNYLAPENNTNQYLVIITNTRQLSYCIHR